MELRDRKPSCTQNRPFICGVIELRKRLVINVMSKIIYDLKDVVFWGNNGGRGYKGDGVGLGDRGQLGYKLYIILL